MQNYGKCKRKVGNKMKIKNFFFHFWPILFLIIVWLIFAEPYFIKNKVPFPSSYQVNNFAVWDGYPGFASPVKNGAMPDLITQIVPWRHFSIEQLKKGTVPLWNPYSFSGTPHLANYQSAVFSPLNILFFVFPFVDGWTLLVLLQPLLAGLFMYLYVRSLKISKIGSLISSISFMFCGFITVWMGYATLGYAILFLPLALFAIEKFYTTNSVYYLILLSLAIPCSFFSGHFQTSIYFALFVALYILYKGITERSLQKALIVIAYAFFGFLISLIQLLPSIEFYSQSLRSNIFQKTEFIPWAYWPTFFAPDFYGNPVTRNDWFGHYAEWNAYIGIVPLMLAVYSLKTKKKFVFFLCITSIVVLALAFPSPLLDALVFLRIPVLSTSAASRIIVLFSFIFATLAGFGFDQLQQDLGNKKTAKFFIFWTLLFIGIFLLLWVIVLLKLWLPVDKILIAKQNLILPTIIFFTAIGLFMIERIMQMRKIRVAIAIISCLLLLLVVFDLLRFVTKWMPYDSKSLFFAPVGVTKEFATMLPQDRVIGNFGAETCVYYSVGCLGGYDALYINAYGQFVAYLKTGDITQTQRSVVDFPVDNNLTFSAIKLLGVPYVAHKVMDDNTVWTFPYWKYPSDQFPLIYSDEGYRVYKNNTVLPRAFFVTSYEVIADPQKTFEKMFSKDFDLGKTIVLEKNPGFSSSTNGSNSVKILSYKPNTITISVTTSSEGLLFLSDPYYNGWKATIDGKQTEILRADSAFRAVIVPKGNHTVIFSYWPLSFALGIDGVIAGIILIIIATIILQKIYKPTV